MDWNHRHTLVECMKFAWSGIIEVFRDERNIRIEIGLTVLTILAGFFFGITKTEWAILVLTIFGVLSLEIMNSAVEEVCNYLRDKFKLTYGETKLARDVAAGSVLLFSIGSVIIGLLVFLPYLLNLFNL